MPITTKKPAADKAKKPAAAKAKKPAAAKAKKPAAAKPVRVKHMGGADTVLDIGAPAVQNSASSSSVIDSITNTAVFNNPVQAGGSGALGQTLKDLAVPFGLVLAKTGFQAWKLSKDKKKASSSSKKSAPKTKTTSTRKRSAVGGSADLSEKFVDVFKNIQDYVNTLQTTR